MSRFRQRSQDRAGLHSAIEDVREGRSDTLRLEWPLVELPPPVRQLTGLRRLDLGIAKIERLPWWLEELPELRELDARGVDLWKTPALKNVRWRITATTLWRHDKWLDPRSVSAIRVDRTTPLAAIRRLAQLARGGEIDLEEICIDGPLEDAEYPDVRKSDPRATKHLETIVASQPRLQVLEINSVPVSDALARLISTLPAIRRLGLKNDDLTDLPNIADSADRLEELDLSENPLSRIPDGVWQLRNLGRLSLKDCPLAEIPADLLALESLYHIELSTEQIVIPPPEVASQGLTAIQRYWYQQLDVGIDYLTEAKLLVVGEPGAGKTSFAKKILDPGYTLDNDEESTHGIDVHAWYFPTNVQVGTDKVLHRDFRANIWDFGGQEIYHATHQFFLTKRSAYALVVDDRKEDTDLEYWLEVIDLLSDSSPLIIIQNCRQGRRRTLDKRTLQSRYPRLCESFSLDLSDNGGLEKAVTRIRYELSLLQHIGTPLPKTWRAVRVALEADPRNYITADEFFQVCESNGFTLREDMRQLGGFLHDLGICLFFQDDDQLGKTVILKPEWGTKAVYRVLDDPAVVDALGVFSLADLERIWHEPTYAEMRGELLRLMTKFALCYPAPEPDLFVAPQLLTPTRPDYAWNTEDDLALRYDYEVMPKGIVRRVIVALHDLIEPGHVWRTGAVFTANASHVEVVEEHHRRRLHIRLAGIDPRILLDRVDRALEVIYHSYSDIKVTRYRPCDCTLCETADEPTMFAVDKLQRFADARKEIQCQLSMNLVDAAELLADLLPDQRSPRRAIPGAPEVFISYKWGGSDGLVDEIAATLRKRGLRVIRDRDEMSYRDSIRAFMRKLGAGKAIVVVINRAYLESPNCMFELTEIAAASHFASKVFPIILPDARIFDPVMRVGYVKYWESKRSELDAAMREVGQENLQGIREDLDLYEVIRNTMAKITEILRDMNVLKPELHRKAGFVQLYDALDKAVGSS